MSANQFLLALFMLSFSVSVFAKSPQATDDIFAALINSEGGTPSQGSWNTPMPEGYEPKDPQALIGYVLKKVSEGADVNAYRHKGNLLAHAIRANQIELAKWLMDHGADIENTSRESLGQPSMSALSLCRHYQRTEIEAYITPKQKNTKADSFPVGNSHLGKNELEHDAGDEDWKRPVHLSAEDELKEALSWRVYSASESNEVWQKAVNSVSQEKMMELVKDPKTLANLAVFSDKNKKAMRLYRSVPKEFLQKNSEYLYKRLMQESGYIQEGDGVEKYLLSSSVWKVFFDAQKDLNIIPAELRVAPDKLPHIREHGPLSPCRVNGMTIKNFSDNWDIFNYVDGNFKDVVVSYVLSSLYLSSKDNYCSGVYTHDLEKKLKFLIDKKTRMKVKDLSRFKIKNLPVRTQTLLKEFVAEDEDKEAQYDWVEDLPICEAPKNISLNNKYYQFVSLPGQKQCAIIIDETSNTDCGNPDGGKNEDTLEGMVPSYPGEYHGSCWGITRFKQHLYLLNPVSNTLDVVPAEENKHQVYEDDYGNNRIYKGITPVYEKSTGRRFFISLNAANTMMQGEVALLAWEKSESGRVQLRNFELNNSQKENLNKQCKEGSDNCENLPLDLSAERNAWPATNSTPKSMLEMQSEVALYAQFISALEQQDSEKLKLIKSQADGIDDKVWQNWVIEAYDYVYKFRRSDVAFFMLKEAMLINGFGLENELNSLNWVDDRFWKAFIKIQSNTYSDHNYYLKSFIDYAKVIGKSDLACEAERWQGLVCGEKPEQGKDQY